MKQYEYAKNLTYSRLSFSPPLHPGAIIRDKRLHLNLTLSELAEHICNTSTLSKIETGNHKATPLLLSKLYEKLNIIEVPSLQLTNWLDPIRIKVYQHDLIALHQQNLNTSFHYQARLIKFASSVLNKDYVQAQKQILILQKMMTYMSLEELQFYYLFLGRYYMAFNEGLLAKNYYHLSYEIANTITLSDPLLLLSLAEYYSLSNDSFKAGHLAVEALSKFNKYYSLKYTIDCELLLCYEYTKTGLLPKANSLLERLCTKLNHSDPYHQRATLFNRYGDYYVAIEDYISAEKMYLQALLEHHVPSETILSLIKLYYHSSQTPKLKRLLTQLQQKEVDFNRQNYLKCQFYYYLVHHPNSDVLRIFLIKEAIPFAKKQHDRLGLELFSKSLFQICQARHKYKEAIHILSELYETS